MKRLLIVALIVASSCSTTGKDDAVPVAVPQPRESATSPELQVALTELLEQVDVLNARIARLESAAAEPRAAAVQPETTVAVETPPSPMVAATLGRSEPATKQPQTAVVPVAPRPDSSLAAAALAESYRSAVVLFGKNRFADARAAFEKVFGTEPSGDLADNALFWVGETYFAEKNYTKAMEYYRRVTTEFAQQNKAPDSMFKTALAYERTGDLAMARETLRELMRIYPYSSSAASAKQELQRIRY